MILLANIINIACYFAVTACLSQVSEYLGYAFVLYIIPNIVAQVITNIHAQTTLEKAYENIEKETLQELKDDMDKNEK